MPSGPNYSTNTCRALPSFTPPIFKNARAGLHHAGITARRSDRQSGVRRDSGLRKGHGHCRELEPICHGPVFVPAREIAPAARRSPARRHSTPALLSGRMPISLIRHGMAKEVSKSEMLENMARSKEFKLVLSADNVQKNVGFMCQCCGCCCNLMFGVSAAWLPQHDRHLHVPRADRRGKVYWAVRSAPKPAPSTPSRWCRSSIRRPKSRRIPK